MGEESLEAKTYFVFWKADFCDRDALERWIVRIVPGHDEQADVPFRSDVILRCRENPSSLATESPVCVCFGSPLERLDACVSLARERRP